MTGELLLEVTLSRRADLPRALRPVTLEGARVRLVPLDLARDVEPLFAVSDGTAASVGDRSIGAYDADALVWRYMPSGPFASAEPMEAWLRGQVEAPDGLCLCVRDRATDQPIGAVNFMTSTPAHLKVELGNIWYGPLAQRTGANTESTFLMLGHAFGLGYRRVEWKCDALNARSRAAALRMGFRFEGIQEQHFIIKDRNRDTAWFRVLDHEWPDVRAHLLSLLDT